MSVLTPLSDEIAKLILEEPKSFTLQELIGICAVAVVLGSALACLFFRMKDCASAAGTSETDESWYDKQYKHEKQSETDSSAREESPSQDLSMSPEPRFWSSLISDNLLEQELETSSDHIRMGAMPSRGWGLDDRMQTPGIVESEVVPESTFHLMTPTQYRATRANLGPGGIRHVPPRETDEIQRDPGHEAGTHIYMSSRLGQVVKRFSLDTQATEQGWRGTLEGSGPQDPLEDEFTSAGAPLSARQSLSRQDGIFQAKPPPGISSRPRRQSVEGARSRLASLQEQLDKLAANVATPAATSGSASNTDLTPLSNELPPPGHEYSEVHKNGQIPSGGASGAPAAVGASAADIELDTAFGSAYPTQGVAEMPGPPPGKSRRPSRKRQLQGARATLVGLQKQLEQLASNVQGESPFSAVTLDTELAVSSGSAAAAPDAAPGGRPGLGAAPRAAESEVIQDRVGSSGDQTVRSGDPSRKRQQLRSARTTLVGLQQQLALLASSSSALSSNEAEPGPAAAGGYRAAGVIPGELPDPERSTTRQAARRRNLKPLNVGKARSTLTALQEQLDALAQAVNVQGSIGTSGVTVAGSEDRGIAMMSTDSSVPVSEPTSEIGGRDLGLDKQ